MTASPAEEPRYDRRDLVSPPDLDARIGRTWRRVATRMEQAGRAPRFRLQHALSLGGALALAALCVVVILPSLRSAPADKTKSAVLAVPASTPEVGSLRSIEREALVPSQAPVPIEDRQELEVSMEPRAEVTVLAKSDTHTRYRFVRGQATFEAPARSRRSIEVEFAGGVRLRMMASRVTVLSSGRTHPRIEVIVETGRVTVESPDGSRTVDEGERLVLDGRSEKQPLRRHEHRWEENETAPSAAAEVATRSPLDIAARERRAGRFLEAARAYEQMMREQPNDPRTPLAAFELGRLRMDHLNDLRGAIAPLQRAVALGGTLTSQEDALARLVRVFDRLNDKVACETERARYLQRFALGIHRVEMEQRCKGTR